MANGTEAGGAGKSEDDWDDPPAVVTAASALEYTDEQRAAIRADPEKNALLVALAGAGKTSVAASQVEHLLKRRGFEPCNVVALTYSVRAADSLRDRITRTVEDKIDGPMLGMADMSISTIHAWAGKLLRDHVRRYARYEIWDEAIRRLFVCGKFDEIGLSRVPRRRGKFPVLTTDTHDIGLFLEVVDKLREERVSIDERIGAEMLTSYRAYLHALDKEGAWDYAQVIAALHNALTNRADPDCFALQKWVSETLRLIILDEAQDLGAAEWAILDRLHELGARLWLVADGRQRIFSFRAADGIRLARFANDYDAEVYPLTKNFRSTEGIVSLANTFLRLVFMSSTDGR